MVMNVKNKKPSSPKGLKSPKSKQKQKDVRLGVQKVFVHTAKNCETSRFPARIIYLFESLP